jgi:hypothetical protein
MLFLLLAQLALASKLVEKEALEVKGEADAIAGDASASSIESSAGVLSVLFSSYILLRVY